MSGGVSNVSFSFRGNDPVREAIHAVFLFHAHRRGHGHGHRQRRRAAGRTTTSSPTCGSASRTWCSTGGPDATERLLEVADTIRERVSGGAGGPTSRGARRPVEERLRHALVEGIADWIVADTEEARLGRRRDPSRSSRAR